MRQSNEREKLLEGLNLDSFYMIRPEGTLDKDMLAIFVYYQPLKKYTFVSWDENLQAFQIYMLTDRMETDVESFMRDQAKKQAQFSDIYKSQLSEKPQGLGGSQSLTKSFMEKSNYLEERRFGKQKVAAYVLGRVKAIGQSQTVLD